MAISAEKALAGGRVLVLARVIRGSQSQFRCRRPPSREQTLVCQFHSSPSLHTYPLHQKIIHPIEIRHTHSPNPPSDPPTRAHDLFICAPGLLTRDARLGLSPPSLRTPKNAGRDRRRDGVGCALCSPVRHPSLEAPACDSDTAGIGGSCKGITPCHSRSMSFPLTRTPAQSRQSAAIRCTNIPFQCIVAQKPCNSLHNTPCRPLHGLFMA
ncbi:hypothetical protein OH77DRAFT_1112837 [Trametes cingulata]|nr:hypothetical protein OH77DRAFT_1112837 [Trametes cingulata]